MGKEMSLRFKKQRHQRSCGLTCVAIIADKPYATVIQDYEKDNQLYWEWGDRKKSWSLSYDTTTKDLYTLLSKYGVTCSKKRVKYQGKESLPDLSILAAFSRQERMGGRKGEHWHWVVCEHNNDCFTVYDPLYGIRTLEDVYPISHLSE